MTKIVTWNVNGIRARGKQVEELVGTVSPDVLCLQEIKATAEQVEEDVCYLPELANHWHGAKGGYSGVSIHVRRKLGKASFVAPAPLDRETRVAVAEIETASGPLTVASVYAPNGGKDYDAKIAFYNDFVEWAAALAATGSPFVIVGDLNIAHTDEDVHPSQRKTGLIGQLPEERALFTRLLERGGLIDAARLLHPDADRLFTWWPYWANARKNNVGWRLDYVLVSKALNGRVKEADVLREFGTSDHAPFYVDLDWP